MSSVIDAHHHLWDPARPGAEWLQDDSLHAINRAYGLRELREVTERNGVDATVLVQTLADLDESIEFCAIADQSDGLVAGVVGWVDLTLGDRVGEQIDRLQSAPGGDHLVGIRHLVQSEADRDWLRRDDVVAGMAAVGRAGLVYDLLVLTDATRVGDRLGHRARGRVVRARPRRQAAVPRRRRDVVGVAFGSR